MCAHFVGLYCNRRMFYHGYTCHSLVLTQTSARCSKQCHITNEGITKCNRDQSYERRGGGGGSISDKGIKGVGERVETKKAVILGRYQRIIRISRTKCINWFKT
jgi:hypothetical protein